jgi:formyl-CoA transferase
MSGKLPELTGNAHPNICPYDRFPTATVPVFLAIGNNRAFQRLCAELAAPDLAEDPRFATNGERLAHRTELTVRLAGLLSGQDGEALCKRLLAAGIPAGPVRDVAQVWDDAHTRHRAMAAEREGYRGWGVPIKLSRTPGRIARTPPRFGEHGREILTEFDFSEHEIDQLLAAGILLSERRR